MGQAETVPAWAKCCRRLRQSMIVGVVGNDYTGL